MQFILYRVNLYRSIRVSMRKNITNLHFFMTFSSDYSQILSEIQMENILWLFSDMFVQILLLRGMDSMKN